MLVIKPKKGKPQTWKKVIQNTYWKNWKYMKNINVQAKQKISIINQKIKTLGTMKKIYIVIITFLNNLNIFLAINLYDK